MNKRIVVIEDDDLVRDTVKLILETRGFEVCLSSNGNNVGAIIKDFKPHIVLTDIYLGKADGRKICQQIKSNPETSHIPVIVMSGAADIYSSIEDFGANDIVLKPFDEQTLLNRLQRQLTA
ncbi:response regulator [Daejeonella sp.]|uniref:response regulator n=1 Tax=Daejeonella sp. TaxID=2805397 RepID=UPI0030BA62A4